MESCIIKLFPKKFANSMIVCFSETGTEFDKYLRSCFKEDASKIKQVEDCMTSDAGNQYQHEIAQATLNLVPEYKGVPWAVVNDIPNQSTPNNLVWYFCSLRSDKDTLKACQVKPTAFLSTKMKAITETIVERKMCPRNW